MPDSCKKKKEEEELSDHKCFWRCSNNTFYRMNL